jgi:hypothetical protein
MRVVFMCALGARLLPIRRRAAIWAAERRPLYNPNIRSIPTA